jgi:hypothetical protein
MPSPRRPIPPAGAPKSIPADDGTHSNGGGAVSDAGDRPASSEYDERRLL